MFKDTKATQQIFKLRKKIRAVSGGTGASKTISILVWCIDYAQSSQNKLVTIVSESYPHLEKGAIHDFKTIMRGQNYWRDIQWNETKHVYSFEGGTIIEFMSVDTYGKAHGPRRDVLFINECNNLPYNIVDQLITRTKEVVWLDWNPVEEFWFYTEMQPNREDIDHITLTYKDNEALDKSQIAEIEAHRYNKNWWTIYGEGKLGIREGKIYNDWAIIDEIPHEARLERYGLDFGYTNDPTAIIAIYYHNGGYILDEVCYQKGLSNKQIYDLMANLDKALVKADSAEPKSIDELKMYGLMVIPVVKGKDSVEQGIQYVQQQRISVTKRSLNLIKEYRNYMWQTDRDGKIINEPSEIYNHLMDALRYGLENLQEYEEYELPEHRPIFKKTGF